MDGLGIVLLVFILGEVTGLGAYLFVKVHTMDKKLGLVCGFLTTLGFGQNPGPGTVGQTYCKKGLDDPKGSGLS